MSPTREDEDEDEDPDESIYVDEGDGDSSSEEEEEEEEGLSDEESVRIGRVQEVKGTTRVLALRNAVGSGSGSRERPPLPAPLPLPPLDEGVDRGRDSNRDSSRSSTSTLTATGTTMIVRSVSIARRTDAYVIDNRESSSAQGTGTGTGTGVRRPMDVRVPNPPSPLSMTFGGREEDEVEGASFGITTPTTMTTEGGSVSPLGYYLNGVVSPSPREPVFKPPPPLPPPPPPAVMNVMKEKERDVQVGSSSVRGGMNEGDQTIYDGDPYGGYLDEEEEEESGDEEEEEGRERGGGSTARPTIVVHDAPLSAVAAGETPTTGTGLGSGSATMPPSPLQRYRGWLSQVVAPLEEFIDSVVDPREHYLDLKEIGESGSGSVFQALLNPRNAHLLKLGAAVKDEDGMDVASGRLKLVAIKSVAIVPSGSPKLVDIRHELRLMKGLRHHHVLSMDAVYVDLVDDALWVRMELMERSLADVIGLVGHGLMLQDRMIARFASDVRFVSEMEIFYCWLTFSPDSPCT